MKLFPGGIKMETNVTGFLLLVLLTTVNAITERGTNQEPRATQLEKIAGDCSFGWTDYNCKWQNDYDGSYYWRWSEEFRQPDHTFNRPDGYLALEPYWTITSEPMTSYLRSPKLPPTGSLGRCITFWFQLRESLVESFQIVIEPETSGVKKPIIWQLDGHTSFSNWTFGRAQIISNETHSVTFVSNKSPVNKGLVTLDDIIFTSGPCSVLPHKASEGIDDITDSTDQIMAEIIATEKSPLTCDFEENNMCNWFEPQDNTASRWTTIRASDPNKYPLAPKEDHTYGKYNGHYVYAAPLVHGSNTSRIASPKFDTNNWKCFSFWYYMYGPDAESFHVYLNDSTETLVWAREKSQIPKWTRTFINLPPSKNISIIFEAVNSRPGLKVVTAIDDIAMSSEPCKTFHKLGDLCDFESGEDLCGFTPDKVAPWKRTGGSYMSSNSIPAKDHTYNAGYGHYIALKGASMNPSKPYQLKSPDLNGNGYKCVRFWYYMQGTAFPTLAVTSDLQEDVFLFYETQESAEGYWKVAQFSVPMDVGPTRIIFTGKMGMDTKGIIALDDILITEGFCSFEGDCNFEHDLCTWTNGKGDFNWILGQGNEDSDDSGPEDDHTLENTKGYYLFMQSSNPRKANDVARLYSQDLATIAVDGYVCLNFWYSVRGAEIGSLSVIESVNSTNTTVWKVDKNHGTNWNFAKVPFQRKKYSEQFIVIEGKVGKGSLGDIAVDDITIANFNCSLEPESAGKFDPPPTPPTPPPGYVPISELTNCSFHEDFCSWNSWSTYWEWSIGELEEWYTPYVPPEREKHGSYAHIASSYQSDFDSVLDTNMTRLYKETTFCFSFWYYMFGSDVGNLTVYQRYRFEEEDLQNRVLFKRFGTQQDRWLQAVFNLAIDKPPPEMKLSIQANIGYDGVIAIDNFYGQEGACNVENVCDFESSSCSWSAEPESPLQWEYGFGEMLGTGPKFDHTTFTEKGIYAYVRNENAADHRFGRYFSPEYGSRFGTQCLKFWYNINGTQAFLIVGMRTHGGDSESLWSRTGGIDYRWHQGQYTITQSSPFQIYFEGSFGEANTNDFVAIDDLEVTPGVCEAPASCTFDDGICGYSNDLDDDFDWLLGFGRTQDSYTIEGPTLGATGKGYYMYVDMTRTVGLLEQSKAILRSDIVFGSQHSKNFCLQFSYIIFGSSPSLLEVFVKKFNSTGTETVKPVFKPLWTSASLENGKTKTWEMMNITITSDTEFELIFEATQEVFSRNAFIGLDEIKVTANSNCVYVPPSKNDTIPVIENTKCDFEKGFCKWENDIWLRGSGKDASYYKLPDTDHTLQTESGFYMYVGGRGWWSWNQLAILTSPKISESRACFKFWYRIKGLEEDFLNIYIQPTSSTKNQSVWSRQGDQGDRWRFAQIQINFHQEYQILVAGTVNYDYYYVDNYIAIDDIEVDTGSCPPQSFCSFDEEDECGFTSSVNDDFEWLQRLPGDYSTMHPEDHTTNSDSGGYMYLDSEKLERPGMNAFLISPTYQPVETACLSFWYYMGSMVSELMVHVGPGQVEKPIILEGQINKYGWTSAMIPVGKQDNLWHVTFHGVNTGAEKILIAIDDYEMKLNYSCVETELCDFESGMCTFNTYRVSGSDSEWIRQNGEQASQEANKLAPLIDSSTKRKTGFYIITGVSTHLESTTLVSHVMTTPIQCVSFRYYVAAPNSGEIYVYKHSPTNPEEPIGHVVPNSTLAWNLEQITVKNSYKYDNYVIIITAETEPLSRIAIDDVMFHDQSCNDLSLTKFNCTNGKLIDHDRLCNYKDDCGDNSDELNCGTCDFEDGECGYWSMASPEITWNRNKAGIAHKLTPEAPEVDHTKGKDTGYYLMANSTGRHQTVTLVSPSLEETSSSCHVAFWYYKTVGSANWEIVVIKSDGLQSTSIYSKYNSEITVGKWTEEMIHVGRVSQPFTMEFQLSGYSLFSIDDIKLLQCAMPVPNPESNCAETEFKCPFNGHCIDKSSVCDYTDDCGDSTDEMDCANYTSTTFETGMGFFTGDWSRIRAGRDLKRDHTTGTSNGYYAYPPYYYQRNSMMYGPVFKATKNCTMRFYYYMNAESNDRYIRVLTRNTRNDNGKEYAKKTRFSGGQFFVKEVITFDEEKNFQVLFQSESSYTDTVAIDDVTFDENCFRSSEELEEGTIPVQNCADKEFYCKNAAGYCVPLSNVCDFFPDCDDGLDELNCPASCDFEKDSCGWEDTSSGMFGWKRRQGSGLALNLRVPLEDHSQGNEIGWFYIVAKNPYSNSFAPSSYFESPVLGQTGTACQFSFWYHLSGTAGKLQILLRNQNKEMVIDNLDPVEGPEWKPYQPITLGKLAPGHQVVIKALVANANIDSSVIDIAIDSINFDKCSLEESFSDEGKWNLSSNFEKGRGAWYEELYEDDFNWAVGSGATPTKETGPEFDHTTKNGSYLYIENLDKAGQQISSKAQLKSPLLANTTGLCLRFWYHMFGGAVGRLNIYTQGYNNETQNLIWTRLKSQGNIWRAGMVTVKSEVPYQIIFEGVLGNFKTDIAIDDISTTAGACVLRYKGDCNFETGLCNYETNNPTIGKWVLSDGYDVYPYGISDHTVGSGFGKLVYADLKNNSQALISSPKFNSSSKGSCFQFFYYIAYGASEQYSITGTVERTDGSSSTIFGDHSSYESDTWQFGQIRIPPNVQYNVNLIGYWSGEGRRSTIALDDFFLHNYTCNNYGSCDFDTTWCGWQKGSGILDWLRNSGKTPAELTGPAMDHTFGSQGNPNGYYAYVPSGSGKGSATIESPWLGPHEEIVREYKNTSVNCITFYYHMTGKDVGSLEVYVIRGQGYYDVKSRVFVVQGDHGGSWNLAAIEIHNVKSLYKIQLVANSNGGGSGDIAIDDFVVDSGECQNTTVVVPRTTTPIPTTTTTTTTEPTTQMSTPAPCPKWTRRCGSTTKCVHKFLWCNDVADCPNGEDEKNCDIKCHSGIYCENTNECIEEEKLCNGVVDCEDTDEAACECDDSYCANNGTCHTGSGVPSCSCHDGHIGVRCQHLVVTPTHEVLIEHKSQTGWIVGVVILLILIILGVAFAIHRNFARRVPQTRENLSIENQLYKEPGIQMSDIQSSGEESGEAPGVTLEQENTPGSRGIQNPLYNT